MLCDIDDACGNRVRIQILLLDGKNVREAAYPKGGHIRRETVFLGNASHGVNVPFEQRFVHLDGDIARIGGINACEHVYLTAADMSLNRGFHSLLRKHEASRHSDGDVKISVIHALELHRDVQSLDSALGAAEACHTFNHFSSTL